MDVYILGISCFYHDSAAVLLRNGEIIYAVQEERFTRKKHDASFPKNAISYCLKENKIGGKNATFKYLLRKGKWNHRTIINRYNALLLILTTTEVR